MNRSTAQQAVAHEGESQAVEHLDLPLLLQGLNDCASERVHVLDFGQVQPGLIARLQALNGRLQVLDLKLEGTPEGSLMVLEQALVELTARAQSFDWVMLWDVLNYFDTVGLSTLNEHLCGIAASGMKLHALIHYSQPNMPEKPDQYRMLDNGQIQRIRVATGQIPAPRYSPKALEKHMPAFRAERMRLLGNGMQELLLTYAENA